MLHRVFIMFGMLLVCMSCQASKAAEVSGELQLDLAENSTAYVQFVLFEQALDQSKSIIGKQDFTEAEFPITKFSVQYPAQQIDSNLQYKLQVIVAADSQGDAKITEHVFPVITEAEKLTLPKIIINMPPKPIE